MFTCCDPTEWVHNKVQGYVSNHPSWPRNLSKTLLAVKYTCILALVFIALLDMCMKLRDPNDGQELPAVVDCILDKLYQSNALCICPQSATPMVLPQDQKVCTNNAAAHCAPFSQVANANNNACVDCAAPLVFDRQTETCVKKKDIPELNPCQTDKKLLAADLPCKCSRILVALNLTMKMCTANPSERCAEQLNKYSVGRCVACDPNQTFDTVNKECVEKECQNEVDLLANDPPCTCSSPRTLVELGGNVKICTAFPDQKCAEQLNKYSAGRCVACDPGQTFDTQANSCVEKTCEVEKDLPAGDPPCQCDPPRTLLGLVGNLKICTAFPEQKCAGQSNEYAAGSCVPCNQGQTFHAQTKKCMEDTIPNCKLESVVPSKTACKCSTTSATFLHLPDNSYICTNDPNTLCARLEKTHRDGVCYECPVKTKWDKNKKTCVGEAGVSKGKEDGKKLSTTKIVIIVCSIAAFLIICTLIAIVVYKKSQNNGGKTRVSLLGELKADRSSGSEGVAGNILNNSETSSKYEIKSEYVSAY